MKWQICRAVAAVTVVGALVAVATVAAHEGATGVVKERMLAMSALGKSMKTISAMVRGKAPYDAAKMRQAAMTIADHGGDRMTALFPEGSHHGPSEATPEIWQDWKKFSGYANEVRVRALTLAEAPEDQAKTAFTALGRTCGGCHRSFRKKK